MSDPATRTVLPVGPADPPAASGMRRRAALQTLLGTAAAGFALPAVLDAQHPLHTHFAAPDVIERAQQKAAAGPYTPEFLDAHQLATLESIAEAIVPGSTTARVAPFLDQLLAVDAPRAQAAFLGSLGAFDMAATRQFVKPWLALSAAERDTLLKEASTADASTIAIARHFASLKDWISGAYYTSEQGMRELGWDGNVFHTELPGCTHPDGHRG